MSVLLDNISDLEGTAQALDYISRYDVTPEAMSYFRRNPDVAKAYAENSYGYDPSSFASTHFAMHGEGEGRVWDPRQPSRADLADMATRQALLKNLPGMTEEAQQAALQQAYGNIGTPVKNTDDRYGGEGQGSPFFQASGLNFLEPTQTGFQGPVSGVFDQPGPGGQYGQYMGTFSPTGQLQNVEWTQQERPSNIDKYGALIPGAVAALAGIPLGLESLASAAAGTPELLIGSGAYAGAAPTASLSSLSTAAGFVEGAGELFTTDFAAANNAVNTVANNPVMTAIADAAPQTLESMAANAGSSLNVPGVEEAVRSFGQTMNQGIDFVRNLGSNIGETLFPNASPEVQRLAGDYAIRYATTGDPEEALKGSVLGFATGQVGSYVTGATGSDILGRAASQATQQLATTGEIDPRSLIASEASRFVGSQVGQATDSPLAERLASSVTRDVISDRDPRAGLATVGTGAFLDRLASGIQELVGQPTGQPAPIEARTAPDDLTQELYPPATRAEAAPSFADVLSDVEDAAPAQPPVAEEPATAAEAPTPAVEAPAPAPVIEAPAQPRIEQPAVAPPVEAAPAEPVAAPVAAPTPVAAPVAAPPAIEPSVEVAPSPVPSPAPSPVPSPAPSIAAPRTPPPMGLGNIIGATVNSRVNNAVRARIAPPPRRNIPTGRPPIPQGGLAAASRAVVQRPPTTGLASLRPPPNQPQRRPVPMRVDPSRLSPVTNVATLSRILANIRRPG